jgi:FkbM family methyltransferase
MSAGIADGSTDEGQVRPGKPAQPHASEHPARPEASEAPALSPSEVPAQPASEAPALSPSEVPAQPATDASAQSEASQAGTPLQGTVVRGLPLRAGVSAAAILAAARWTRWLEPELLGLSSLVGPGSVCVDVGAAAGIYTLPLSRLAGPSGLVHSVEPLPFAWPTWNRLLHARSSPNVLHHAVALGSEPGQASMSVPKGRHGLVTGRSFISQHCLGLGSNAEFAQHITYPVAVDTLDGMLAETDQGRLDFIKIDVEGAELHVLQGGAGVIESFLPAMLIEIEARHTIRYQYCPEDVVSWLSERGYAMYTWRRGWHQASEITAAQLHVPRRVAVSCRPGSGGRRLHHGDARTDLVPVCEGGGERIPDWLEPGLARSPYGYLTAAHCCRLSRAVVARTNRHLCAPGVAPLSG